MTATTDRWQSFLEAHVGDTESPSGSNCCDICRQYGPIGASTCYAWCCATQDLALSAAFGNRLLETAGVRIAREKAKQGVNGLLWIARADLGGDMRVGDLPCYDWQGRDSANDMHIEGCVNPYTQSRFQTIGGNVQNRCDYWWRSLNSSLMGVIRPPWDLVVPVPVTPQPPEEDVARAVGVYVCRKSAKDPKPIYLLLDSANAVKVNLFADTEEIFGTELSVEVRQYGGADAFEAEDGHNIKRKVHALNDLDADAAGLDP